ncbi:MAG: carbon monoxide dehydrogenase, partial [Nitrospirota bacterium]
FVVANKTRGKDDLRFIKDTLGDMVYLGAISFSDCIMQSDIEGISPFDNCPDTVKEVDELKSNLAKHLN